MITESTAGPFESRHNGKRVDIIYATFTTPSNALSGSAVCAFRLHDVERVFDGAFKEQAALNYNWLPVPAHKVPEPRPGQCVNDSQTLPDVTLNFIKSHSLMDDSVTSMLNEPLIVRTGFQYVFFSPFFLFYYLGLIAYLHLPIQRGNRKEGFFCLLLLLIYCLVSCALYSLKDRWHSSRVEAAAARDETIVVENEPYKYFSSSSIVIERGGF